MSFHENKDRNCLVFCNKTLKFNLIVVVTVKSRVFVIFPDQ